MDCTCIKQEAGTGKGGVRGYIVSELCPECKAKQEADAIVQLAQKEQEDAQFFLVATDWKVVKHRDQLAIGIETSLTNEEYVALLTERQVKRDILD